MNTIFNNAVKAGAVALAAVAVVAMLVAALNRLWSEAAIFAGGTVPPLWFLWHHRGTVGRGRSRRAPKPGERSMSSSEPVMRR